MAYVILLLVFGSAFILCFELMPKEMNFSVGKIADFNRKYFGRLNAAGKVKWLKMDNFRRNVQRKLTAAGNPFEWDPDEFVVIKELAATGLFLAFQLSSGSFLLSLMLAAIGFFLPDLWLNEKITRRKRAIVRELPYFIDMLTLSVEAGFDFGAAMNRIIQKNGERSERNLSTPLTEELRQMQEEIKLGRARRDALHNLAKRVDIPEISSFTSVLIQADNMGSPLGTTLRAQSEQMRSTRFLRAEKIAHEAPVKMLFPLIIFIFPVIFIVLFGPVILQLLSY